MYYPSSERSPCELESPVSAAVSGCEKIVPYSYFWIECSSAQGSFCPWRDRWTFATAKFTITEAWAQRPGVRSNYDCGKVPRKVERVIFDVQEPGCLCRLCRRTMLKLTHRLVFTIRHTPPSPDSLDSIVLFGKLRRTQMAGCHGPVPQGSDTSQWNKEDYNPKCLWVLRRTRCGSFPSWLSPWVTTFVPKQDLTNGSNTKNGDKSVDWKPIGTSIFLLYLLLASAKQKQSVARAVVTADNLGTLTWTFWWHILYEAT